MKTPEDAAEEAHGTARVVRGKMQAAEQQAQVVQVGGAHGRGRIISGGHGFTDEGGKAIEFAGIG